MAEKSSLDRLDLPLGPGQVSKIPIFLRHELGGAQIVLSSQHAGGILSSLQKKDPYLA